MLNCKSFLVTEAERKHVRRRASLVAVALFLPGRAKDLSAPLIYIYIYIYIFNRPSARLPVNVPSVIPLKSSG